MTRRIDLSDNFSFGDKKRAFEMFDWMMKANKNEHEWQDFFCKYPFIFSDTIPVNFDTMYSQVQLSSGGRADFLFNKLVHPDFFSTTGLIELKRPDQRILKVSGSRVHFSSKFNEAKDQITDYFKDLNQNKIISNQETIAIGNNKIAFIIIGNSDELVKKLHNDILRNQFSERFPLGLNLLTYDFLFNRFKTVNNFETFFLSVGNAIVSPIISLNAYSGQGVDMHKKISLIDNIDIIIKDYANINNFEFKKEGSSTGHVFGEGCTDKSIISVLNKNINETFTMTKTSEYYTYSDDSTDFTEPTTCKFEDPSGSFTELMEKCLCYFKDNNIYCSTN